MQAVPVAAMPRGIAISRSAVAAAALVATAVTAIWVATGVTLAEVFSYLAYLALAIVLPGILLCRLAIPSDRAGLADLCLGIPVGIAMQVVGFVALASIGLRPLAWYAAPAVGILCVLALLRRRRQRKGPVRFVRGRWLETLLIGGLCLSSVVLMAARNFPEHTLPRDIGAGGVAYYRDMPWHLGTVGAAKRTWPLENPRIAGEPLHYHVGAHIFQAGTSTVTGIDIATLLLRLDPVVWLMLLAVQLVWTGREWGGRGLVGVGAAYIVLLSGDASSLWRQTSPLFFNLFVTHLYLSPTYLLGLVLFLPLVVLSGRLALSSRMPWSQGRRGEAIVWLLLVPACALTKSTILPVLAAGAAGFAALHLLRHRTLHLPSVAVAIGAVVAFFAVWPVVIDPSAAEVKTMTWNPLGSLRLTPMWKALRSHMSTGEMTAIVLAGHAPAILTGIAALVAARAPFTDVHRFLAMLALAGAGPALLFTASGNGQLYFWFYGYVALAMLASMGFAQLLTRPRTAVTRLVLTAGLVAVIIGTLSIVFQSRPGVKQMMGSRFRVFQRNPDNQVPDKPAQISAGMAEGLLWVAHNTDPGAVIAVNDRSVNFYYSALTQRAVFIEKSADEVDVFSVIPRAERHEAVGRLFGEAGPEAICETARRYGIGYLVNVKPLARPALRLPLPSGAAVAFDNDEIGVVSLSECRRGTVGSRQ